MDHDPGSVPWVTEQTPDGQRLASVHEDVRETQVDEEKTAGLPFHVVAHPQRVGRDHLVAREDPVHVRRIEDGVEVLGV